MDRDRGGDDHGNPRERGELRSEIMGGNSTSSKSGSSNIRREKDQYDNRKEL